MSLKNLLLSLETLACATYGSGTGTQTNFLLAETQTTLFY